MSERWRLASRKKPGKQRFPVLFADLDQGRFQSFQVGIRQRLVGSQPADDQVIEMIAEVFLDLLLVLSPGHLRHVERPFFSNPHNLILEVRVDDLALLLVQEGDNPP